MQDNTLLSYIKNTIDHMPSDWLNLTTHRLDIYNESLAKDQFLEQFENLYNSNNFSKEALTNLPTAFDYIRLGHPLSCILEWTIAIKLNINQNQVISFDSKMAPILAVLRKNLIDQKATQILYTDALPPSFNAAILKTVYGYTFELKKVKSIDEVTTSEASTLYYSQQNELTTIPKHALVDFVVIGHNTYGSIIVANGEKNRPYISEIQHVRRRETIAMTPANSLEVLQNLVKKTTNNSFQIELAADKKKVQGAISKISLSEATPLVASSGLSIQYAILMGLVHEALEKHPGKEIKIIVPPNCYGGTNDQARRVAACIENVEVMDLPVDGGNDMVQSIDTVLATIAQQDAIPYIIAEIPTNPRVEVPDLDKLKQVLSKTRNTNDGGLAIEPVFILDQTFCPNVHFIGKDNILASVKTISFASGSKFPSGGLCTAGYCVANNKAASLLEKIELHLLLCDNEATPLQYNILAKQLPSMNDRIKEAYLHTRDFVDFIKEVLPKARINFVSESLAQEGFTPSVFSLDLPTKGKSAEERESYKRALNLKLINTMIGEIPNESKYCVSYGQLKGCYWTIPATSTQGTTKEGDKDYIARVALSPNLDVEKHKRVFMDFVQNI